MRSTLRGGSSPLARGLPTKTRMTAESTRIIPARAGFTAGCGSSCGLRWDHSRSRGVYQVNPAGRYTNYESSPLARGLPRERRMVAAESGIIPARAGFTGLGGDERLPEGDHPRSRGVYRRLCMNTARSDGSSPLARGLLSPSAALVVIHGIIPARAGFTMLA